MRLHDYPISPHKAEHDALVRQVLKFQEDFNAAGRQSRSSYSSSCATGCKSIFRVRI